MHRPAPLLLLLAVLLLAGRASAQVGAEGDNTPIKELAWHDGEVIFTGTPVAAPLKTVPPNASAATPDASVPCACSDAAPRDTSSKTPPFLLTTDCFGIAYYSNCNASFMSSYLAELVFNQGFCQISCGRCSCCTDAASVLQKLGANRFLQALQVAQPNLTDLLGNPGWAGTVLVPTDAAWDAMLAAHPTIMQDPALLQQVLKFHLLPPEPRTRGLWTTPFMSVGARLWTMTDGNASIVAARTPLPAGTTAYGGLTGVKLQGPVNSATVVGPSDVMACKAYLTVIDTVLLPFDPTAPALAAPGPAGTLAAATGAGQCVLQANAIVNGSTLVAGAANRQHSVGDCCAACGAHPTCNSFSFCALKGGCRAPDGTSYAFGFCQLTSNPDVAAGHPPAWAAWSATTPLVSGYVAAAAPSAPSTPTVPVAGRRLLSD